MSAGTAAAPTVRHLALVHSATPPPPARTGQLSIPGLWRHRDNAAFEYGEALSALHHARALAEQGERDEVGDEEMARRRGMVLEANRAADEAFERLFYAAKNP